MAIAQNFPNIRPSLNLSFALTKALDPRITFARASAATYYGTDTAKAEENLLLQSQTMTTSPWIVVNASTTGSKTAPDGTSTAIEISATSTNGRTQQLVTIVSGLTYTMSMFVRRVTGVGDVRLIIADSSGTPLFTTTMSLTADWQRFTVSGAPAVTSISCRVIIDTSGDEVEIWGAQLEERSAVTSYTPTTTQPITNFVPVLESAAAGEARFDHNPVTGESLGLLIEESRTNLLLRSEEFNNVYWTKGNVTITVNTIVAPNGTLTGDKLVENTTNTEHALFRSAVTVTAAPNSFSIFAKAGEVTNCQLRFFKATNNYVAVTFDLAEGTVSSTGAGSLSGFTNVSSSITAIGNGWYRLVLNATLPDTSTVPVVDLSNTPTPTRNTGGGVTYTGDGFGGIFLWGASLEQGAFPTSYVKTTTAQVTRAADAASMTGANFFSWYNAAEGTLYSEHQGVASINQRVYALSNGTGDNTIDNIHTNSVGTGINFFIRTNAVNQITLPSPAITPVAGQFYKLAGAYQFNNAAASRDGGTAGTSPSVLLPVVDRFFIGKNGTGGAGILNGHIRKLAYYPKRIANDQLQGLTT